MNVLDSGKKGTAGQDHCSMSRLACGSVDNNGNVYPRANRNNKTGRNQSLERSGYSARSAVPQQRRFKQNRCGASVE